MDILLDWEKYLSTINYQLFNMKTSILTRLNPLTVSLLASTLIALPAFADMPSLSYQGANVYKDSKGSVYKVSNADVNVEYSGVQVSKSLWSDACGFARVSFNHNSSSLPSTVTFNGGVDTISALDSVTKPGYKCTNGVAKWGITPQTNVFKVVTSKNTSGMATGEVIYYPPSRTGGSTKQVLVTYTASAMRTVKPTCGFVMVNPTANSQRQTSTVLSLDGTSVNLATLPVNPAPPECVKGKLFTGGAASAAVGGNVMYRTTKAVYITGQTVGSANVVKYDTLRSRTFRATESCGLFVINFKQESPVLIKIGTTSFSPTTVASTTVSSCGSSGFAGMMANTLYKNGASYYYKVTDLTKTSIGVETPYLTSKNITVNSCGFATIPSLNMVEGFTPGDKLIINGSVPYDVSTLPLVAAAPRCQNGVVYTAQP